MNANAKETTVEWAPFIKISSVTDKQLIKKADAVNSDFLIQQKGFIKRELIKKVTMNMQILFTGSQKLMLFQRETK